MASVCVSHRWVGGLIAVAFVLTMALYAARWARLKVGYAQASANVRGFMVNCFWFSETMMTIVWLASSFSLILEESDFGTCYDRNFLFSGAVVFSIGVVTWPIVLDDYSTEFLWPGKEEAAMLLTFAGSATMTASLWVAGEEEPSFVFVKFATLFMAVHFLLFDLVGWSLERRYIRIKRRSALRATQAMQADWNSRPSVFNLN